MIPHSPQPPPNLNLGDIYYVLFRHKWKIVLCFLAGIGGAAYMYKKDVPPFQSQARLLVRYIFAESKSAGPANTTQNKIMADERGATIMGTEKEILQSSNLAAEVAAAVGPERILAKAGGGKELGLAVAFIRSNLTVTVPQASTVIHLSFKHPDPDLAQTILRETIDRYHKLHVEAHRASGLLGEGLVQEVDTLRSRLAQTEDELRKAMNRAGVTLSVESTRAAYANQMTAIQREIYNYEGERAGKIAVFEDIKKRASVAPSQDKVVVEPELPPSVIDDYRSKAHMVNKLQSYVQDLSVQFTSGNIRVQQSQAQLAEAETELKKLREQYPGLVRAISPTAINRGAEMEANEASSAWIQITAYEAKIKELNSQYEKTRANIARLEQFDGLISELVTIFFHSTRRQSLDPSQ